MKIAIVSADGVNVNEHFGKADSFLIYEITEAGLQKIEERKAGPLSVGDPNHSFDKAKFDKIAEVIADCKKVYITQIGEVPGEKLKERGIEPVIHQGAILHITC